MKIRSGRGCTGINIPICMINNCRSRPCQVGPLPSSSLSHWKPVTKRGMSYPSCELETGNRKSLTVNHLPQSRMRKGYLALVLHAHLPYVRHPESPEFLEEDWLFEAITETYIPLWQVFEGLVRDGVPFRLTMSITPTLCAMLNDELLRERYLRYLDRANAFAKSEINRTQSHPETNQLARLYFSQYEE